MSANQSISTSLQRRDWCHTEMKLSKSSLTWTIENFSLSQEKKHDSSIFSCGENEDTKWCISVYPNGIDDECKDHVSLYLCLKSSKKSEIRVKYKLTILSVVNGKSETSDHTEKFNLSNAPTFGIKKFLRRESLLNEANGFLPEDNLTIICDVTVLGDYTNISGRNEVKIPKSDLSENLGILLKDGTFSDITFVVDGRELQAHKAILGSRSEVFAAMFAHEMKESNTNLIEITDTDFDVLKEMLHYIYTGEVLNLDEMAKELISAAEKYRLKGLSKMCEASLSLNLSIDKAAETLILADLYGAEQLKDQTKKFILTHASNVMKTVGWKNLISSHLHLGTEIFLAIAHEKCSAIKT